MPKFVSFVFKVLIGAILIGIFVSFFTAVFISFLTVNRVQNLAQIVQMDIAENNCMLNEIATSYDEQVTSILDRSQLHGMNLINWTANRTDISTPPAKFTVTKKGDTSGHSYIQATKDSNGHLDTGAAITDGYYVANYGDILVFNTNLSVVMQYFFFQPTAFDDGAQTTDFQRLWLPPTDFTLSYEIPALTYIK